MEEAGDREISGTKMLYQEKVQSEFRNIFRLMEQYASSPLLVNSLMQFDQESLALKDYVSSLKLFDYSGRFSIVSFDGSYLYGDGVFSESSLQDILEEKQKFSVRILSIENQMYSVMVPIYHRKSVEGVMVFNGSINLGLENVNARNDLNLSLFDGRKELKMGHSLPARLKTSEIESVGGLKIYFYYDKEYFLNKKYSTLIIAAISILVLGFIMGFLFYRRGKKEFLNPHEKLVQITEELNSSIGLKDSILNSSELMIISTNKEGIINVFNRSAEAKLGFSQDEVIGRLDFVDLIDEDFLLKRQEKISAADGLKIRDPFELLTHETLKTKRAMDWEAKMITASGEFFPVRMVISPIGKSDQIQGFVFVLEDITKVKLVQRAERQAVKELERVAELKSEFLANMSHEIRTPMNGILGMVNLLNDTSLDEKQRDMLNTIQSSGDGLMTILNDVLDFSKMESGKMSLEYVNFHLEKSIQEALFLVQVMADGKGLKLSYEIDDFTPEYLFGDITRIRQVLVNFLTNAVKFTEKGSVKLFVETSPIDSENNMVSFQVKDTGIGISEENQRKLFTAFAQADASITRKYGGTGLGLAISNQLIDLMGGSVKLESSQGIGSIFTAKIPLKKGKPEELDQENSVSTAGNKKLSEVYYHKILVAEDNSINQKLAKMMLSKLGYSCDIVGNGFECLRALKDLGETAESPYTLIFMDMQMPEMDGLEATRRVIEKYQEERPYIVAMTANAFKEDRDRCFEAGMDDFVAKPIKMEELERVLIKYGTEITGDDDPSKLSKEDTSKTKDKFRKTQKQEDRMSESLLFNREELLKSFDGDEAILQELVSDFNEAWPGYISDMRSSLSKSDLNSVEIGAHTLKGLTATFKAMGVRDLAYKLEQKAGSGDTEGLEDAISELETALQELCGQLSQAA